MSVGAREALAPRLADFEEALGAQDGGNAHQSGAPPEQGVLRTGDSPLPEQVIQCALGEPGPAGQQREALGVALDGMPHQGDELLGLGV
ncbi:hypothetical protein [Pyxidicoccus caerfyrddinensis]|uniref:hypothetical protein n=1 Tax=Pyxidicoccus caerfyrddinensis TaxID=2709663 RepID=UPI0013DD1B2E|nr:hypothetical protein [Pyxidicoccus caerfyrddinensis]